MRGLAPSRQTLRIAGPFFYKLFFYKNLHGTLTIKKLPLPWHADGTAFRTSLPWRADGTAPSHQDEDVFLYHTVTARCMKYQNVLLIL